MSQNQYLLVQSGPDIELAAVDRHADVKVGSQMRRDPTIFPGTWTIIKIFENDNAVKIAGLVSLIGIEATRRLFKATVRELVA